MQDNSYLSRLVYTSEILLYPEDLIKLRKLYDLSESQRLINKFIVDWRDLKKCLSIILMLYMDYKETFIKFNSFSQITIKIIL